MESTASILARRKIGRIEKQISDLRDEAYDAYWNIGDLACQAIERQIKPLERELVALERMVEEVPMTIDLRTGEVQA
jgi:hypothetical protein